MWLSRSSQFQRQESGLAPYSKRVLFVCERNLVESVMAEVDLYFFLLVAANKRGENQQIWTEKNGISTSVISVTWAPYILDFLIFVTKCAVQKISSWQPSCPWFFFRQYSTTWVLIWPGVGRETLLVQRWSFFPSSCFCLGTLNFCCNQISYFVCLISIISCYESLSDVGEIRVWFASKILTPCRMHWNAFLIAQIKAKCHSFPNMCGML